MTSSEVDWLTAMLQKSERQRIVSIEINFYEFLPDAFIQANKQMGNTIFEHLTSCVK